jgi:hypothetical protein
MWPFPLYLIYRNGRTEICDSIKFRFVWGMEAVVGHTTVGYVIDPVQSTNHPQSGTQRETLTKLRGLRHTLDLGVLVMSYHRLPLYYHHHHHFQPSPTANTSH